MSDPEAPPEVRGGPIWRQGPDAPPPAPPGPPGTVPTPPTQFQGATDPTGREDELYRPSFARDSGSPVPHMVASFVLMAAAWWGLRWSTLTLGATDPVRTSEWWTSVNAVLLPSEDVRFASYSETRMWVALALLLAAAAAIIWWIGRIGSNLRPGQQPFGVILPFLAFPAWWLLPLTIGITSDPSRSRSDLLVRYLVAFGILFAQFLLLRWPTLNRIWRAGGLPYDPVSIVLWLPMMIPWSMFLCSTIFSLLAAGSAGDVNDSAWQPTEAMLDWARTLTRASGVGLLVLLVVVTIVQHRGVAGDRAALEASRQASREGRVPLLPPGV